MSRLARAIEILEAIQEHYKGNDTLSAYALILDDATTIQNAIDQCLGQENEDPGPPPLPHSQRRRYGVNFYSEIWGWIGKRKIEKFATIGEAEEWIRNQR